MQNQAPLHQPALVNALLTDNHGNIRGSLRGDVEARRVAGKITVEVPADPYVTKLERSCDAATHDDRNLTVCLRRVKPFVNPLFAQLKAVCFGLFSGFERSRSRFDSFDFYCLIEVAIINKSPRVPLILRCWNRNSINRMVFVSAHGQPTD